MKIQFSLPTNEAFFNRYATLAPTLSKLGIIAQIISAVTEIGIIYNIILSRVIDFTPEHAYTIATIGAIIGTAFIELGLREFTPYSIKAFLYNRFKGLDLAMTIFILIVNCVLLGASGYLSFNGSTELIKIAAPTTKVVSTNRIDSIFTTKQSSILKAFKSDSLTIANGYQKQINAQVQKYNSLIVQQQTKFNQLERKEQRTGLSYSTRKESVKGTIAKIEADKAHQTASLEATRANELINLVNSRKKDIGSIESTYLSNSNKIERSNTKIIADATKTIDTYGLGLGWFSLICLFVFVLSVIIGEIHKKGSNIEQVAIPNQYHFSDSIQSEFFNMVSDKYNYYTRFVIQWMADKTPPPPLPIAPPTLYDLTHAKQQRLAFSVEDSKQLEYLLINQVPILDTDKAQLVDRQANQPQAKTPTASKSPILSDLQDSVLKYLEAAIKLRECNLHGEADNMELKADQVLKAYLGNKATEENVGQLRADVIGFLNGKNDNPFTTNHRQPIGFNRPKNVNSLPSNDVSSEPSKASIRKSYNDTLANSPSSSNERVCAHCSTSYTYRHHKQKYCTDDCRKRAWEAKTGKQLKLKKKK